MGMVSLSALVPNSLSPEIQNQVSSPDGGDYQEVAYWIGAADARPTQDELETIPNGERVRYAIVYEDQYGNRSFITQDSDGWEPLNHINQVNVFDSSDLPEPTNGTHTLERKVYVFNGFITSPYSLDISNGPALLGRHPSQDGFIHTGGNAAITGTNGDYFQESLYVHSPGGTLYNISGDQSTEMLVLDSGFSDAAGIGQIASLGTVDGYRVPTWKNCNFEDFADGITFDGSPDKIFITASPFRTITASGVDIFTLAGTSDVRIVDFVNNYIKNVQSDTVVWRVESGGEPAEVMQYRGTVHDTSFNVGNAITGPNASPTVEPFWVSDAHPVRDSTVTGELYLTTENTVTISSAGTWYEVNGPTQTGNEAERTTQANNGTIQYVGEKNVNVQVTVNTSFTGANGDTYEIALAKNGTVEPASTMEVEAGGQNSPVNPSTSAIEDLQPNDTLSLQVRNIDGANDATFRAYVVNFMD
jgi:hypothetical protein